MSIMRGHFCASYYDTASIFAVMRISSRPKPGHQTQISLSNAKEPTKRGLNRDRRLFCVEPICAFKDQKIKCK